MGQIQQYVSEWRDLINSYMSIEDPVLRFSFSAAFVVLTIYVLMAFLIGPVKRSMKVFGKDILRAGEEHYLSLAWLGWGFMFLGVFVVEVTLLDLSLFARYDNTAAKYMFAIVLISVGMLFNVRNYCKSMLAALREKLQ